METLQKEQLRAALRDTPNFKRVLALAADIKAANSLDDILADPQMTKNILALFDTDRLTIYKCLHDTNEIRSVTDVAAGAVQIRVPMNAKSIAGYVASREKTVNIRDAYDLFDIKSFHPEIGFDRSWDQKTGYLTRQVLCVPIADPENTFGVLQLLNKTTGNRFTDEDVIGAETIAEALAGTMVEHGYVESRTPTRFDLLLYEHLLKPDRLKSALDAARNTGQDVEDILVGEYGIKKGDLGRSLSAFYQCKFMRFDPNVKPPQALRARIEGKFDQLKTQLWMPIGWHNNNVTVIMGDPHDLTTLDLIKSMFQPRTVEFVVGFREDVLQFIEHAEEGDSHPAEKG